MTQPLEIPRRPSLSARVRDDGLIVIQQDTGGQEPEDTPMIELTNEDANRIFWWLREVLGEYGT